MKKALVGRQPIYRADMSFFAYELLWRQPGLHQVTRANSDKATAEVFLHTFLDIGLDQVVGPNLAFINVTRHFLLNDLCTLLPPERVVLEILEDTEPDDAVLQAIGGLSKKGYRIALDDFAYEERLRPLVELAHIVKIDMRAVDKSDLKRQVEFYRQFGVKLVAEKVETYEEYDQCRSLGFDFFQGFFFCRPQVIGQHQIPANRMTALRVVAKLQDPAIHAAEAEDAVNQDLAISYKLLRYVNSSWTALKQEVHSVRHAVALVGTRRICDWASIMLLAKVENKPRELVVTAMVRARMCERLGHVMGAKDSDQFFTVGLFSVLDALLDQPMAKVLENLPLSDEVKEALTQSTGRMGAALTCVHKYEQGLWNEVRCENLSTDAIRDAYIESIEWTRPMIRELAA